MCPGVIEVEEKHRLMKALIPLLLTISLGCAASAQEVILKGSARSYNGKPPYNAPRETMTIKASSSEVLVTIHSNLPDDSHIPPSTISCRRYEVLDLLYLLNRATYAAESLDKRAGSLQLMNEEWHGLEFLVSQDTIVLSNKKGTFGIGFRVSQGDTQQFKQLELFSK